MSHKMEMLRVLGGWNAWYFLGKQENVGHGPLKHLKFQREHLVTTSWASLKYTTNFAGEDRSLCMRWYVWLMLWQYMMYDVWANATWLMNDYALCNDWLWMPQRRVMKWLRLRSAFCNKDFVRLERSWDILLKWFPTLALNLSVADIQQGMLRESWNYGEDSPV